MARAMSVIGRFLIIPLRRMTGKPELTHNRLTLDYSLGFRFGEESG